MGWSPDRTPVSTLLPNAVDTRFGDSKKMFLESVNRSPFVPSLCSKTQSAFLVLKPGAIRGMADAFERKSHRVALVPRNGLSTRRSHSPLAPIFRGFSVCLGRVMLPSFPTCRLRIHAKFFDRAKTNPLVKLVHDLSFCRCKIHPFLPFMPEESDRGPPPVALRCCHCRTSSPRRSTIAV